MVECHCVERAEARQVILEGRIVAVPGHHVEGTERLRSLHMVAAHLNGVL